MTIGVSTFHFDFDFCKKMLLPLAVMTDILCEFYPIGQAVITNHLSKLYRELKRVRMRRVLVIYGYWNAIIS